MRGIASSIRSLNPDFRVRLDSSPVDRGRTAGDSVASEDAHGHLPRDLLALSTDYMLHMLHVSLVHAAITELHHGF